MTPIEQLKQTKAPIKLDGSETEVLYDYCPDFHFVFDVEVTEAGYFDPGTNYAPPTTEIIHGIEITKLIVLKSYNYFCVKLSESELDEIVKELINRIEIN